MNSHNSVKASGCCCSTFAAQFQTFPQIIFFCQRLIPSVGLRAYKHLSLMLVGRVQAYSNTCSAIAAQLQHNCSIFAANLPIFFFISSFLVGLLVLLKYIWELIVMLKTSTIRYHTQHDFSTSAAYLLHTLKTAI